MIRPALRTQLKIQTEKCIECKLCRKKCLFLQKYGSPKKIAQSYDSMSEDEHLMAYECSLCDLCAAVCPVKINPAKMFLEMRREFVERGRLDLARYRILLNYEKRGKSKLFTYHGLPAGCTTVFFPGCSLSGSREHLVRKIFGHLEDLFPKLGIVLDCCTKPSHDLGRQEFFLSQFDELKQALSARGIKKVLVACPSCFQVFKQYGDCFEVEFIYESLIGATSTKYSGKPEKVMVHDPCSGRNESNLHQSIRKLINEHSLSLHESKSAEKKTLCCGEGGAVCYVNDTFASNWGKRRQEEAQGLRIITYCAGCAHFLSAVNPSSHILDLVFDPVVTMQGKNKVVKSPWTYISRLRLKRYFKRFLKIDLKSFR